MLIYFIYMYFFFFLMIRRPPRSTQSRSSAASDVYKRQVCSRLRGMLVAVQETATGTGHDSIAGLSLSLIHISEPTRLGMISYAVFCLNRDLHRVNRRQRQMCIRDRCVAGCGECWSLFRKQLRVPDTTVSRDSVVARRMQTAMPGKTRSTVSYPHL